MLLILLAWCLPATAQPHITPQKLATADPAAILPGQVKLTYLYTDVNGEVKFDSQGRASLRTGDHSDLHTFKVTVGLVEDVDLSISTSESSVSKGSFAHPQHFAGPGDVQLALRWRFLNEPDLQLAVVGGPTFDTGAPAENLGQGFNSWRQALVVKKDWDHLTLAGEVFYSFPLESSPRGTHSFGANAALGYQVWSWLQPEVELNYVRTSPFDIESLAVTGGLVITPAPNLTLLVGVQQTIEGRNTDRVTRKIASVQWKH